MKPSDEKVWQIVGGAVVVLLLFGAIAYSAKSRSTKSKSDVPESTVWDEPVKAISERPPVFKPGEDTDNNAANKAKADAAERAVYDYCSRNYVFREGSTLTGQFVPIFDKDKRDFTLVNVSVTVFDKTKTNGNVLWYEVRFAPDGKPGAIVAHKDASAKACGIPAAEAVHPL